ncbi:hypothetical protein DL95DRAFT_113864 [Leptodontidium sp. 2 PMI_412]|nr:hypothetical protein DL95DRAFT_113864 [Leptodontidium sp. 2 PMI_412]
MCFGRTKTSSESPIPSRVPASDGPPNNEKTRIPTTANKKSTTPKFKDDEYGESMGLSMHAKHQKMIREAYPDGNVPEELRRFKETGMVQGALGGPIGGGAGMDTSGGF